MSTRNAIATTPRRRWAACWTCSEGATESKKRGWPWQVVALLEYGLLQMWREWLTFFGRALSFVVSDNSLIQSLPAALDVYAAQFAVAIKNLQHHVSVHSSASACQCGCRFAAEGVGTHRHRAYLAEENIDAHREASFDFPHPTPEFSDSCASVAHNRWNFRHRIASEYTRREPSSQFERFWITS
jgi:hypothetical protein